MVQQTLNLSPETIADFARQVQDIMPACPVTDVPEQKRGAFAPRFVIQLSSCLRTSEKETILLLQKSLNYAPHAYI